jgi:hypothetical protein
LRTRATRLNVSVAELVRKAVDAYVGPTLEERRRRAIEASGRFGSGRSNVAERHDEYLAEAYRQ